MTLSKTKMVENLRGDGFSFPCLRIVIFVNGKASNETISSFYSYILDESGFKFPRISCELPNKKATRVTKINKGHLTAIKDAFTKDWVEGGFRFYGDALVDTKHDMGVPFFSIEQLRYADYEIQGVKDFYFVELALPVGFKQNDDIVAKLLQIIPQLEVMSGFIGYGFFTSIAYESIISHIVRYLNRYRVALAFQLSNITKGLKYGSFMKKWHPNEKPGISGVGWKTFVGKEFFDRLDMDRISNLTNELVKSEMLGDTLVLTAGSQPTWGDVNLGEDISPYQTVGSLLKPISFPRKMLPVIGDKYTLDDELSYFENIYQ